MNNYDAMARVLREFDGEHPSCRKLPSSLAADTGLSEDVVVAALRALDGRGYAEPSGAQDGWVLTGRARCHTGKSAAQLLALFVVEWALDQKRQFFNVVNLPASLTEDSSLLVRALEYLSEEGVARAKRNFRGGFPYDKIEILPRAHDFVFGATPLPAPVRVHQQIHEYVGGDKVGGDKIVTTATGSSSVLVGDGSTATVRAEAATRLREFVDAARHQGTLNAVALEAPAEVARTDASARDVAGTVMDANSKDPRVAAEAAPGATATAEPAAVGERSTVFVVHGRDLAARAALFDFLRSLHLRPLEWEQAVKLARKGSPFIWDVVRTGIASAHAVVVLLTGDDEARLRDHLRTDDAESLCPQPRPNVLMELGMALMNDRHRTVLLQVGELRRATDIDGIHLLRFDNVPEHRRSIIDRLRTVGCVVNDTGTDWMTTGRVPDPPKSSASPPSLADAGQSIRCEAVACLRLGESGFRDKLSVAVKLIGALNVPGFRIDGVKLGVRWYAGPVDSGTKHFDASHFLEKHDGEVAIRKDWLLTPSDVEALDSMHPCASVALEGLIRTSHGELPCRLGPIALARGHAWNSLDTDRP